MPSSAASAAMLGGFWAKLNVSSVMLMWKCLAMWRCPATAPTAWPIAAQWITRALHAGRNARQLLLGGGQQLGAFAGPLFGQQRVFADHQALARIVGAGDLVGLHSTPRAGTSAGYGFPVGQHGGVVAARYR